MKAILRTGENSYQWLWIAIRNNRLLASRESNFNTKRPSQKLDPQFALNSEQVLIRWWRWYFQFKFYESLEILWESNSQPRAIYWGIASKEDQRDLKIPLKLKVKWVNLSNSPFIDHQHWRNEQGIDFLMLFDQYNIGESIWRASQNSKGWEHQVKWQNQFGSRRSEQRNLVLIKTWSWFQRDLWKDVLVWLKVQKPWEALWVWEKGLAKQNIALGESS